MLIKPCSFSVQISVADLSHGFGLASQVSEHVYSILVVRPHSDSSG